MELPQMRTLPQLAAEFKECGLTYSQIYHWLKEGRFPYIKRGNKFIVNRNRFIEFLETADEREPQEEYKEGPFYTAASRYW